MQLSLVKLAPALAAGCTVVLKGAPQAPLLAAALGELIANETDIPAGVVNVLASSDPAVGELLTTHPDVDMVSFTGSRSEEHTSELQSLMRISYAVFCLTKKHQDTH